MQGDEMADYLACDSSHASASSSEKEYSWSRTPERILPPSVIPGHIRSDNGPEFVAKVVRDWITAVGAKTAYIMPGSPWENGYCESFNSSSAMNCSTERYFTRWRKPG
jgi:transposase InsO family protein